MSNEFGFLNYIENEAGPAPKDSPAIETYSEANTDYQDCLNEDINDSHNTNGSPNISTITPILDSHRVLPIHGEGYSIHDGKSIQQKLRKVKTYGFRKNVNRTVFKGSGYADRDESGNYDPNDEATAKKKPVKRKITIKSRVGDEEVLPTIEEDIPDEGIATSSGSVDVVDKDEGQHGDLGVSSLATKGQNKPKEMAKK